MPFAMKQEFDDMTNSNKCKFIFSAMNMKYCVDFERIYKSMSSFISKCTGLGKNYTNHHKEKQYY